MLDVKSRAEAEQEAQGIQAAHAKGSGEDKAKLEETLGLRGAEVAGLTAVGFIKAKRFQQKYRELPDSTVEKVVVHGDNATVYYVEPDDDKVQLTFVRQEAQWRAHLVMPRVSRP